MDEPSPQAKDSQALQILITEHYNLQAIRTATVSEANGRTALFLGAVSSGIVALAFIGQISSMGSPFHLFLLILLPSLLFLGVVTFIRVYQASTEDMIASRGINRIRHYYTEVAPAVKDYLILSTHDDLKGMLDNMGVHEPGWWQIFVSTPGLVGVINSILAAVFASFFSATLLAASLAVALVIGAVVLAISIVLHYRYQTRSFGAINKTLKVMFPSGSEPHD